MKFLLSCLMIAVLSAVVSSAAVDTASRANLNVGSISASDRLLYKGYFLRSPNHNAVQTQDVVYTGLRNTRISAIRAHEVGQTQHASAWIIRGGIRDNNVTIRLQSARGYGFYYMIEIWGQ